MEQLAGQRKAGGVSNCTRWRDASGRRLREARLCRAHRDRRGRGTEPQALSTSPGLLTGIPTALPLDRPLSAA